MIVFHSLARFFCPLELMHITEMPAVVTLFSVLAVGRWWWHSATGKACLLISG
jgi:hypothetical protein